MRIHKPSVLTVLTLLSAIPAHAFDPSTLGDDPDAAAVMRYGYSGWKDGRGKEAADAFAFAARKEHLPSQWKLARMHQTGDGIPQDHALALENFRAIADRYSGKRVSPAERPFVRSALVETGRYFMNGVKDAGIGMNARKAERYLYAAAALHRDADAQFLLGRLYTDAAFEMKRPKLAARWFNLAAVQGHREAKTRLARMFLDGNGVRADKARGLALLAETLPKASVEEHAELTAAYRDATSIERKAFWSYVEVRKMKLPDDVARTLSELH